jgi:hypothetical protein
MGHYGSLAKLHTWSPQRGEARSRPTCIRAGTFTGETKMFKQKGRIPIDSEKYYKSFGMEPGHIDEYKLKEALKRAWETRNFEIDKFWTRVAYFWGFIALIFGAYITIITKENGKAIDMHLDLYLVLLGLIFSVAWLLVIYGSKSWQKNWEEHINKLEDSITGPLYKTIYCTRKPYYSVSGINRILAWTVIGVWGILIVECIVRKKEAFAGVFRIIRYVIDMIVNNITKDCLVPLSIAATIVCIFILCIKGRSDHGNFRIKEREYKEGFIDIGKDPKEGERELGASPKGCN